jgi:hypothetical protein
MNDRNSRHSIFVIANTIDVDERHTRLHSTHHVHVIRESILAGKLAQQVRRWQFDHALCKRRHLFHRPIL